MDNVIILFNYYFDHVFARAEDSSIVWAILFTCVSFLLLYGLLAVPAFFISRKLPNINNKPLRPHQLQDEITGSAISIIMFSLLSGVSFLLLKSDVIQVAGNISVLQWLAEFLALYCWNEIHFYTAHRLLHTRPLYARVHMQHHRSITVTPLAAWRFHWLEALILGSVLPLALVMYDFSVWSLICLPLISIFWNIVGHSNWKTSWPLFGDISEDHAYHHSHFNGNFGFSVNILDRLFSTMIKPDEDRMS